MASASSSLHETFTGLLTRYASGDQSAHQRLTLLVYAELRRIARRELRHERPNHTLQPTALANEAYLRLGMSLRPMNEAKTRPGHHASANWKNRAHFLAIAAQLTRRVLVDYARAHNAAKRGGHAQQITLTEPLVSAHGPAPDVLLVNELLKKLTELDPRQAQVVEIHFFGGMTFEEIALVLNMTARTAKRDWSMARAWLHNRLSASA